MAPDSLLPDMDGIPSDPQDGEGITVAQRRLLLESLEVVLDVFDEPDPLTPGPLLAASSLSCIVAQVAALLEQLQWLRAQDHSQEDAFLDLESWRRTCGGPERGPPSSRVALAEELQACRQRMLVLERELEAQAKTAEASASHRQHEHEKATARLLDVNRALEAKLKQRTLDCREVGLSKAHAEGKVQHQRWLAEERAREARGLGEELAKSALMHQDVLAREREYGKRVLRLHVREFESSRKDEQRQRRQLSAEAPD